MPWRIDCSVYDMSFVIPSTGTVPGLDHAVTELNAASMAFGIILSEKKTDDFTWVMTSPDGVISHWNGDKDSLIDPVESIFGPN